jgi:hypothetical protein
MTTTQADYLPVNPRIRDNNDAVVGDGLSAGYGQSKSERLAEMICDPEMFRIIGAAWPLYFRLALKEGGKMVGTYDDIGQPMDVSGKTARNWVKTLEKAKLVTSEMKGHQISIELVGKHMEIAQAKDEVIQVMPPEAPRMTLRQRVAMKLVEVAEETGTKIELKMVI